MKKSKDPIPIRILIPIRPTVTAELPASGRGAVVMLGAGEVVTGERTLVGTIITGVEATVGAVVGREVGVAVGLAVGCAVGKGVGVGARVGDMEGSINWLP